MTRSDAEQSRRSALTGLAAALAAMTMLFAALASAYVVRRGISSDWVNLPLPRTLYASVVPGALGLGALEAARRNLRFPTRLWLLSAAVLGAVFALMHISAWRQLHNAGILLQTSPTASFFFVISGAFLCCVTAGILALVGALVSKRPPRIEMISYYWQYLNALWIFLLLLLYIWR